MKKLWYVCMLLTVCLVGCNKTDDLWDDVNDLKTRVTALEKTVQDLNWNIEAVRELCKEGATITDIELKDGIYTITLSNGKTLKLVEETGAGALIPQMGIDNDGYWTVSYDNGSTFTQLKDKSGNAGFLGFPKPGNGPTVYSVLSPARLDIGGGRAK